MIWQSEKEEIYLRSMKSHEIQKKLQLADKSIDSDVNSALRIFVDCLLSASHCMNKTIYSNGPKRSSEWFDQECALAKKDTRHKLRIFRASRDDGDIYIFVQARKQYKQMLKFKQRSFRREKVASLAANLSDSAKFWKDLKEMGCSKKQTNASDNIPLQQWYTHFKDLFSDSHNDHPKSETFENIDIDEESEHIRNAVINEREVISAVNKLKSGKACGLDGVLAEMLKSGAEITVPFMTKLFNVLFYKGIYPAEWAKAIIIPIHKKGNIDDVDNYRGVALLSIVSKCYTTVLNTRLYGWLEEFHIIAENQAGFRKNYSTVDQICNLHSIVKKISLSKRKKTLCRFCRF
jgi:ribosomal protein L39E